MNNVKIKRSMLLAKVLENRAQHRELFQEASENYRKKYIKLLTGFLAKAKAGKKIERKIDLPEPMDHTPGYDRAITMLKMSVEDVIEITEERFQELVLDQWEWRDRWFASNIGYSSKIAKLSRSS